jgi:photosystem II stability/assembly factor-like uncharacterized protein
MKRFLCIAGLFCVASFSASNLHAQNALGAPEWLAMGGAVGNVTAIYFIDPLHGVTAANGGFYYTTLDQWNPSTTNGSIGSIRSIRFIQGKLYAASQGTDVLVSTDSGKTWSPSGLNLNNANDVYADGSGTIRILTDPMMCFARIDPMHCVATGNGSIFVSSDGGQNWTTAVTGINTASTGVFGDSCYHTFICPGPKETEVLRSADSGQTWQSVITGSYPYPEFIYGASTVPYLSDMESLFRSTDDGVTWKQITSVAGGPYVMGVGGPMGEHAWINFQGGIWKTTDGGDGFLHSGVNLTDSNGAPLLQQDTFSVPFLLTSMCNPFLIAVPFEADVPGMSETISVASNNPGDFSIMGSNAISLSMGDYDSLWLAYDPHHSIDTATITFENHWNCSDWTETRTIIILSYPSAQIVPPAPFAGNCKPATEAAFVKLDSCSTLIIDSVNIPPKIASRFHLNAPLPDTLRLGVNDSLFFTFDPADTLVTISDSIEIFAHILGTDLNDALNFFNYNAYLGDSEFTSFAQFIPVHLVALPSGVALFSPDSAVSLQRASSCERAIDTSVTFTNVGCTPDTIVQTALSGTGYSMTGASAPIIIPSDSSISFELRFVAPDTGLFQGMLNLTVNSNESKTLFIPLSGVGLPPMGILSMPTRSIETGGFSICLGDTVVMDTLSNTGCDTLVISNVSIIGDSDFTIVSPNGNLLIPPDSIGIVTIHFKPLAKGPRIASVSFHSSNLNGTGFGIDTGFAVSGGGLNGTMILSADPSFDVGLTSICQEIDTFFVVQNIGCDTLNITAASLSSSAFYLANDSTQAQLIPGAYDTIWLKTQVDTTGGARVNIDSLTIVSDGTPSYTRVVLSREIAYPVTWRLYPSPPDSASAGTDVTFKIIQSGTLPSNVTTLDFTLTYNDDLLGFIRAEEPSVDTVGYMRTSDALANLRFQVSPVGSDSVIATLHFFPYVAAILQTAIDLDSISLSSSLGLPNDCIASITSGQTRFTLVPSCGSDELSTFLQNGSIIIDNISPNPASGGIVVGISDIVGNASGSRGSISAELSIIDALGRTVLQQNVLLTGGGKDQFQVNIEDLPSGIYAVQLHGAGLASTREFIKE